MKPLTLPLQNVIQDKSSKLAECVRKNADLCNAYSVAPKKEPAAIRRRSVRPCIALPLEFGPFFQYGQLSRYSEIVLPDKSV